MHRVFLLAVLLCAPLAVGSDDAPASAVAAREMAAAWDRGDREAIARRLHRAIPDPWLIAFRLSVSGRPDVAAGFADVRSSPDLELLRPQVARWKQVRIDDDVLARWDDVEAAYDRKAWRDVLYRSAEVDLSRTPFLGTVKAFYRGMATFRREALDNCVPLLTEAVRRAEEIGWLQGACTALWHLGHAQQRLRAYEDALESWTRCAALFDRRRIPRAAALARGNLGALVYQLADYRGAIRQLSDSLLQLRKLSTPSEVARTLRNLAWAKEGLGEYADALRDVREARRISVELDDVEGVADSDIGLATIMVRIGDYEEALRLCDRAMAGYTRLGGNAGEEGISRTHGTRGLVLTSDRQYAQAVEAYAKARDIALERKDEETAEKALAGIAVAEGSAGELDAAIVKLGVVRSASAKRGDLAAEINSLYWIAEFERQAGHADKARPLFREALDKATRIARADQSIDCLLGLTELDFAEKRYAKAMRSTRRAVAVMNRTVRGLSQEHGAMARAPRERVLSLGMQAAGAVGDATNFSYFLECGRAGALLETLEAREAIRRAAIPETLRRREEQARTRAAAARTRMRQALTAGELETARASRAALEAAERAVDDAMADIRQSARAGADLLYADPAPLREIQSALAAGDALVEYAFAGERLYALFATRETARVVRLGSAAELDALAAGVAQAVADPEVDKQGAADATGAIRGLAAALIAPLGVRSNVRRLLVLPDSKLQLVPLCLLDARLETIYIPSGTSVLRLGATKRTVGQGVLALGDPVYPRSSRGPRGRDRGGPLTRLPGTRAEAQAVGTTILLDKKATESGLRSALRAKKGRWRSVHLACHGGIDARHPMRSWLALTPAEPDDGFLTGLDVLHLRIDADLTVLSACESGRGKVYPVEGLIGLNRAFLLAGAPLMLVSLWRVDDDATLALMKKFYELWAPTREGVKPVSASQALKGAQDHIRAQKGWERPYYWAAWVLWGIPD